MKKGLTLLASLTVAGLMLTGCGSKPIHHHDSHPKTTAVKKSRCAHSRRKAAKPEQRGRKSTKVNKKDIDKSGLSDSDIKKDSRAVHQKKSSQPVD